MAQQGINAHPCEDRAHAVQSELTYCMRAVQLCSMTWLAAGKVESTIPVQSDVRGRVAHHGLAPRRTGGRSRYALAAIKGAPFNAGIE